MVYNYNCFCYNISIRLAEEPKLVDDEALSTKLKWVTESRIKRLSAGKLSLGGIRMEHNQLTKKQIIKSENSTFTLFTCCNCNYDVYAVEQGNAVDVYLNSEIPQESIEERLKTQKDYCFSNLYKILLKEDHKALNSLLECPDESELEAFRMFNFLQEQLHKILTDEHKRMEQRIEAFKLEQQELFKQFQVSAYHDRKLLWHRLSEVAFPPPQVLPPKAIQALPPQPQTQQLASLSDSWLNNKDIVIFEDYNPDARGSNSTPQSPQPEIKQPAELRQSGSKNLTPIQEQNHPEQSKNNVQTSENKTEQQNPFPNDLQSENAAVFDFDEESNDANKQEKYTPELPEEVEEPQHRPRGKPAKKIVADLYATSVPISIAPMHAASTYHPKSSLQREKEVILSEQMVGSDPEADLSKSFDVPFSQNRRIASYI